ncbi:NAD(P)/FAD-dependent oxidoreductase [Lichenihabitans sp. Uapishka_5]|uniref:NAD(P)/FAD-dependent oxidoreductase n=1 Tax=Lichenihabitans sp. Uapishka_5 TaxID=3037302 RepID=UPI003FA5A121
MQGPGRLRVVVVGAGFGGLPVAESLANAPGIALTVIDARNHHLFQPLLYQVATAALSPADIAAPVREILPAAEDVTVLMAEVTGVDTAQRQVHCHDGRHVPYDRLVIASGSQPSYFGHPEWAEAAPSLKSLEDAIRLRDRGIAALERAARAPDAATRRRHLTFVLIGGGPTGVEMAGAIGDFVSDRLDHVYGMASHQARVILVEAGPRILSAFDPALSAQAARDLAALGVEVRTGTSVTAIAPGRVTIGHESIDSETVIWTAGTTATPVAQWLGVKPGHGGRVAVGADLTLPGHPDVFVIGDVALAHDGKGAPLPALAPVAKQQGHYVAGRILGTVAEAPFRYTDYGTLATIGRDKAIAEIGPIKLTGRPAWLMWAFAHILFLISFRSRAIVSLEWFFAYATHARSAGLLIGDLPDTAPASPHPTSL